MSDLENIDIKSFSNYIELPVSLGDVVKSVKYDGYTTSGESKQIVHMTIKNASIASETGLLSIGQKFERDEILFSGRQDYMAPFLGRIGNIKQKGKNIDLTLVDYENMFITASIDQKYLKYVSMDQKIPLYYNDEKLVGIISFIGYMVVDNKFEIHIKYDDPNCEILPGSKIQIQIVEEKRENVVCIDNRALKKSSDTSYYVKLADENGDIQTVSIDVGLIGDSTTEVISGITVGMIALADFKDRVSDSNASEK